jgi:hypothetical protein
MVREMALGQPVEVPMRAPALRPYAYTAAVAEQFGYAYADIRAAPGGARRNGYLMSFVPDHRPQARERAEHNWTRYPDAAATGALPQVPADVLELFKARISYDFEDREADRGRTAVAYVFLTLVCVIIGVRVGIRSSPATAAIAAGATWAVLMSVTWFLVSIRRRKRARYTAILEAAGFTQTPVSNGRSRYLPETDQLPGPGTSSTEEC